MMRAARLNQYRICGLVIVIFLSTIFFLQSQAFSQSVDGTMAVFPAVDRSRGRSCLKIAQKMKVAPIANFSAARVGATDKFAGIAEWNQRVGRPLKTGFQRYLPVPVKVFFGQNGVYEQRGGFQAMGAATKKEDSGDLVWGTAIRVEEAYRLRLHFTDVALPEEAVLWVYDESGQEMVAFGTELIGPGGDIWTPSVGGETIGLEIRVPEKIFRDGIEPTFKIVSVMEIFEVGPNGEPMTNQIKPQAFECLQDAACYDDSDYDPMSIVKEAIAKIIYVDSQDEQLHSCSGAMISNTAHDQTPYFLTAYHCIQNQTEAITVEATFDYIAPSCGGTWPDYASLPKVNGATLLAPDPTSDSSLLRFYNNPPGTVHFLGWTRNPVGIGKTLHRIHHPNGWAMSYSTSLSVTPLFTCVGAPKNNFIYSTLQLGASYKGSSGAPVLNNSGQILGKLFGACGDSTDPCNPIYYNVDGRLDEYYSKVAQYIDPPIPPPTEPSFSTDPGIFRNGVWFLDKNGNDIFDNCVVDRCFGFGLPNDTPVVGDWNNDGIEEVGVFRNGVWFLDINSNNQFDDCVTDSCIGFGLPGDSPILGDWNGDGIDDIGVFRNGVWFLDSNGNRRFDNCVTDACFGFGLPSDRPIAGDWNGDGVDEIGIFRNGGWTLDMNGNFQFDGCITDKCFYFGLATDKPVIGDWNGDGIDEIGIFRNGGWTVDRNGNFSFDNCSTDGCFGFGISGDTPVVGRWR